MLLHHPRSERERGTEGGRSIRAKSADIFALNCAGWSKHQAVCAFPVPPSQRSNIYITSTYLVDISIHLQPLFSHFTYCCSAELCSVWTSNKAGSVRLFAAAIKFRFARLPIIVRVHQCIVHSPQSERGSFGSPALLALEDKTSFGGPIVLDGGRSTEDAHTNERTTPPHTRDSSSLAPFPAPNILPNERSNASKRATR